MVSSLLFDLQYFSLPSSFLPILPVPAHSNQEGGRKAKESPT